MLACDVVWVCSAVLGMMQLAGTVVSCCFVFAERNWYKTHALLVVSAYCLRTDLGFASVNMINPNTLNRTGPSIDHEVLTCEEKKRAASHVATFATVLWTRHASINMLPSTRSEHHAHPILLSRSGVYHRQRRAAGDMVALNRNITM